MNLPGVIVDLPTLTEKDIVDLQEWGVKNKVDFIAASFVRKPSDVIKIREVLGEAGKGIKIICKIENQEGMENYDEILKETDAIMVARGDVSNIVETTRASVCFRTSISRWIFSLFRTCYSLGWRSHRRKFS
jgi:pyruvate kinase